MKSEPRKSKQHQQTEGIKAKPVCGTLAYLAECRGTPKKIASRMKEAPSEIIGRIESKQPAAF
jgi:hypothetical protein